MFWDKLIKLCADNQTSPTKAITKIGLSKGSLTAWKAGRIPSDTVLRRIADYFGTSVDYLLGTPEEKLPAEMASDEEQNCIVLIGRNGERIVRHLTPEQIEMLDSMTENLEKRNDPQQP
jgi:transcriptional regulator with XRE-family HTH domain